LSLVLLLYHTYRQRQEKNPENLKIISYAKPQSFFLQLSGTPLASTLDLNPYCVKTYGESGGVEGGVFSIVKGMSRMSRKTPGGSK